MTLAVSSLQRPSGLRVVARWRAARVGDEDASRIQRGRRRVAGGSGGVRRGRPRASSSRARVAQVRRGRDSCRNLSCGFDTGRQSPGQRSTRTARPSICWRWCRRGRTSHKPDCKAKQNRLSLTALSISSRNVCVRSARRLMRSLPFFVEGWKSRAQIFARTHPEAGLSRGCCLQREAPNRPA